MNTEKIIADQLQSLQKTKGNICVSIILPTHRISPERRVDLPAFKRSINAAKQLLQFKYTVSNIQPLLDAIDDIYQKIDFSHNSDGLGIYISSDVKLAVQFPFPVEEKIMVADNFEIRDLLYKANYSAPFLVILLTKKEVRLFKGVWNEITEIVDQNYPIIYEEQYIYNPPSRGTPFTGHATVRNFEKEKSNLEEIRIKDFFHKADELLSQYIENSSPLIVMGVEKDIAWFERISMHGKNIIQKIQGNYDYLNEKQLADITWPAMYQQLQSKRNSLIKELEEKQGGHMVTSGIQNVWQAAKEGKGLKLLVEKDFRKSGFVTDAGQQLHIRPPEKAYITVTDAVDDIMEMVLKMGGQVFFTENTLLKDFQHIALINRY
jgi:hypothetical protein